MFDFSAGELTVVVLIAVLVAYLASSPDFWE